VSSYPNYIGGQWSGAASGRTFETRNPATLDWWLAEYQDDASDQEYGNYHDERATVF
jgi:acyl-CoA reductase-like NAD-dependent aldehyde dehydrogenase